MSGLLELLPPSGRYTVKNVPPAQKEFGPVCPYFDIIAACGELVDVASDELNKRVDFCGEYSEKYDNISILSGSAGYDYTAKASCREIYEKLQPLMELATETIELPSERQIRQQILHTESFDEQEEILHKYNAARKKLEAKIALLTKWRSITFDSDSMTGWSDEGIIGIAKDRFNQLQKIVLGDYDISKMDKAAQNCPVSPRTHRQIIIRSLS